MLRRISLSASFGLVVGAVASLAIACGEDGDEPEVVRPDEEPTEQRMEPTAPPSATPVPTMESRPATPTSQAPRRPTSSPVPTKAPRSPTQEPILNAPTFSYVVQSGDTFSTIAQDFGIDQKTVHLTNPDNEPRSLTVGEVIDVPVSRGFGVELPNESFTLVVEPGDTLSRYARIFDEVTVKALQAANPDVEARELSVGQRLVVPGVDALSAAPTSTPSAPRATPTAEPASRLTGFLVPIRGACLPSSDNLMPNATRDYRFGTHEGVDFWPGYACAPIERGTPVYAAKDGVVSVATLDYQPLTQEEWEAIRARAEDAGETLPDDLFRLRGRQVEIGHSNGVRTRYAHLSRIADGVRQGARVTQGQLVGYVGNSGTPSGIDDPDASVHLHFEIRVGDSYLGAGEPPAEVRRLYEEAFGL